MMILLQASLAEKSFHQCFPSMLSPSDDIVLLTWCQESKAVRDEKISTFQAHRLICGILVKSHLGRHPN